MSQPNDALQGLMELALDVERKHIASGKEVMPKFFAEDALGRRYVIATDWPDEEAKVAVLERLREFFQERNVIQYVLVSEVWVATYIPGSAQNDLAPCERPDRTEALQILGVEYGSTRQVMCRITSEGKARRCGEPQWDNCVAITGRMVGLLPKRKMSS